jgi:hypothetical protein
VATREFAVVIIVDNASALAKVRHGRNLIGIVRDLPANSRSLSMVIAQEPTEPLATPHRPHHAQRICQHAERIELPLRVKHRKMLVVWRIVAIEINAL